LVSCDGIFKYNFNVSDLRKPWISCLGQGEGISMLMRAYRHTGEQRYLEVARRAAAPFLLMEDEGGVQKHMSDGRLFIEEYPRSRQTHVLNGAVFGLVGLAELLDVIGENERELCRVRDEVAATIAANLEGWSIGRWTLYNIEDAPFGLKNGATVYYHLLHIAQLRYMAQRFPQHAEFARYAQRWTQGVGNLPTRMRALAAKLAYRAVTGW
jgi:heparosan-N-sulfate-glucuronate 5-epimerase